MLVVAEDDRHPDTGCDTCQSPGKDSCTDDGPTIRGASCLRPWGERFTDGPDRPRQRHRQHPGCDGAEDGLLS